MYVCMAITAMNHSSHQSQSNRVLRCSTYPRLLHSDTHIGHVIYCWF